MSDMDGITVAIIAVSCAVFLHIVAAIFLIMACRRRCRRPAPIASGPRAGSNDKDEGLLGATPTQFDDGYLIPKPPPDGYGSPDLHLSRYELSGPFSNGYSLPQPPFCEYQPPHISNVECQFPQPPPCPRLYPDLPGGGYTTPSYTLSKPSKSRAAWRENDDQESMDLVCSTKQELAHDDAYTKQITMGNSTTGKPSVKLTLTVCP